MVSSWQRCYWLWYVIMAEVLQGYDSGVWSWRRCYEGVTLVCDHGGGATRVWLRCVIMAEVLRGYDSGVWSWRRCWEVLTQVSHRCVIIQEYREVLHWCFSCCGCQEDCANVRTMQLWPVSKEAVERCHSVTIAFHLQYASTRRAWQRVTPQPICSSTQGGRYLSTTISHCTTPHSSDTSRQSSSTRHSLRNRTYLSNSHFKMKL